MPSAASVPEFARLPPKVLPDLHVANEWEWYPTRRMCMSVRREALLSDYFF